MESKPSWWKLLLGLFILGGIGYSVYLYNSRPDIFFYAETGHDETESFTLPDSTRVILNELSVLRYRESPIYKVRNVDFRGEGFFEVTPDVYKPFVIKTRLANVSVLGTTFNVKAKPEEDEITVSVETGKVKFHPYGKEQGIDLLANEEGSFKWKDKRLSKSALSKKAKAWREKNINKNSD